MLRGDKVTLRAVEEGRMREHIWLDGRYVDKVIMGVLRGEWHEGGMVGQGDT